MTTSLWYALGQTQVKLRIFIPDTLSLVGNGKTGLTLNSAGLVITTLADNEAAPTLYRQTDSTLETITTLGTFAAPTATKARFREIDSINLPGYYEVQLADARWAVSGATYVDMVLPPVSALNTGMYRTRVQLTALNPQDATAAGLSALTDVQAVTDLFRFTGNDVRATLDGEAVALVDGAITDIKFGAGAINENVLTPAAELSIAAALLNADASDNNVPGTVGEQINLITSAASAAAIWNYLVSSLGAATTVGGYLKSLIDAIKGKTDLIGAGTGTLITPTNAATGNLQTEIADDYTVDSGRILPSQLTDWWSVLGLETAQSITYTGTPQAGGAAPLVVLLDIAEDVLSPTQIQLQFTRALTDGYTRGTLHFKVVAVLDVAHGGDHVTLWEGTHTLT